jgi:hypothetical protein
MLYEILRNILCTYVGRTYVKDEKGVISFGASYDAYVSLTEAHLMAPYPFRPLKNITRQLNPYVARFPVNRFRPLTTPAALLPIQTQ